MGTRRQFIKSGLLWIPSLTIISKASGERHRSRAIVAGWHPTPAAASGTTFVTGQTLGTPGTDIGYYLGCQITIGGSPVTVTQLGRWTIAGNSESHSLRIYADPLGTPSLIASVTVNTAGATPGQFLYGTLASPVVLSASTVYAIVSDETSGVDQHYGADTTITHTGVATVNNAIYTLAVIAFGVSGGADNSYCPMSFKYSSP